MISVADPDLETNIIESRSEHTKLKDTVFTKVTELSFLVFLSNNDYFVYFVNKQP